MTQLSELLRTLILGTIGDPASSQELIEAVTTGANAIPDQTGQSGKVLSTDGTDTEWISTSGLGDVMGGGNLTTVGSVPYVSASGTVTQTPNLFWDNTNKRLTVGASNSAGNTPARATIYAATTDSNGTVFSEYVGNTNAGASYHMRRALGTPGTPLTLTNNQNIGSVFGQGWDGTGSYSAATGGMQIFASPSGASWSNTDHGSYLAFTATQPGTTTRKNVVELSIGSTGKSILGLQGIDQTHAFGLSWDGTTTFQWLLPSTQGSANTFLKNDGSGNLSWVATVLTDLSNLSATTAINSTLFQFSGTSPVIAGSDTLGHPNNNLSIRGGQNNSADGGAVNITGGSPSGVGSIGGDIVLTRGTGGASNGVVKVNGITYPDTDGTNGQVLTTNGSGVLSFATVSGGADTSLSNLSAPTLLNVDLLPDSPSSGAINLGSNSRWWNNIHVDLITPHASHVTVQGDLSMGGGQISAVRGLTFDTPGPGHLTMSLQSGGGDISYVFSSSQGAANTVLLNDGSGNLSWFAGASGSFTTVDAKTVTVVNGLITSIV